MAKSRSKTKKKSKANDQPARKGLVRRGIALFLKGVVGVVVLVLILTIAYGLINPPTTPYMFAQGREHGGVKQEWVSIDDIAPVMARSAVAAEDANFCLHWGLDVRAIRAALDEGSTRGASTISQQVVKNVYLWQGRSWVRKATEALWTPLSEAVWSKRRILELYLNVAEFDTGVFGVQAAARHYFGVDAIALSPTQAARLAAVLPSPKRRSASDPTPQVRRRAASILDGAATIAADGRSDCFEH